MSSASPRNRSSGPTCPTTAERGFRKKFMTSWFQRSKTRSPPSLCSSLVILFRLKLTSSCPGGLWGTRWGGRATQKCLRQGPQGREPQGLGLRLCSRTHICTTQKHKSVLLDHYIHLSETELYILVINQMNIKFRAKFSKTNLFRERFLCYAILEPTYLF